MELIKRNYQKIISYGLIIAGILFSIVVLIVRPQRLAFIDSFNEPSGASLTKINFPYSQTYTIMSSNPNFIELRFEDDSIINNVYNVTVRHGDDIIFNHLYEDEKSNIIRLSLAESNLNQGDEVVLTIDCQTKCENVKFNQYNIDNKKSIRILEGFYKTDIGLFWYSAFAIVVGGTLMLLSKGEE